MTNAEGLELLSEGGLRGSAAWSWVGSRLDHIAQLEAELAEIKAILSDALEDSVMYQRGVAEGKRQAATEIAELTKRVQVLRDVIDPRTYE